MIKKALQQATKPKSNVILAHSIRFKLQRSIDISKKICFDQVNSFHTARSAQQVASDKLTVDDDEIEKFGAMSEEWWDPYGNFKLLHSMNPPRVQYILRNAKELMTSQHYEGSLDSKFDPRFPLKDLKILDVGCGGGLLAESLARLGAKVTAIDASPKNIAIAKLHLKKDPVLYDCADRLQYFSMTSHDLVKERGENYFDIVCSLEVIEHVNNPNDFVSSLALLVKKGNPVFLSTVNRNLLSYFLTILMAEHVLKLTPVGTHHHDKYITPEELVDMFNKNKLSLNSLQNIYYNPLSNYWSLGSSIFPAQQSTDLISLVNNYSPVNYISMAIKK